MNHKAKKQNKNKHTFFFALQSNNYRLHAFLKGILECSATTEMKREGEE